MGGMASTVKVTVTLPVDQIEGVRRQVAEGRSDSISGFVRHAVGVALDDVAGWGATLATALEDTGGELTDSERRWADDVLSGRPDAEVA